jgi:hypothetical protein
MHVQQQVTLQGSDMNAVWELSHKDDYGLMAS